MAFVWELTKETIDLPLGCLQGGVWMQAIKVLFFHWGVHAWVCTSLMRNSAPPGPYSRPMPRALWWS